MARLRTTSHEEGDTSEGDQQPLQWGSRAAEAKRPLRSSPRKKAAKSYLDQLDLSSGETGHGVKLQPKSTPKATLSGKQRRLVPLNAGSLGKPLRTQPLLLQDIELEERQCNKGLFSRRLPPTANKAVPPPPPSDLSDGEKTAELEVEESIWCGSDTTSDSEDELPSPRKFLHFESKPKPASLPQDARSLTDSLNLAQRLQDIKLDGEADNSRVPFPSVRKLEDVSADLSRPVSSSDKENHDAILRFSPSRLYSPPKYSLNRPVTPPQSPTKSRLQSPTKTKTKVPSPKIRQSLDAFWNAETVNEWNDQYSPRKVLKSPKKLHLVQEQRESSPTTSPRKAQSPCKRTKAEREARQAFEDKKHSLAEAFLCELDDEISCGQIRKLASSTGGVRIIWSKTLNSTAGRANWRRETAKTRGPDGTTATTHKHHASIELAEKVIDDEHRLLNVLAHEFCHLANFMVSGIKDQPHGKQFKHWGKLCTDKFGDRGVVVTTKHTYEIEYKYIWRCTGEDCESEFKRHSKSIDPKRHTCGRCRGHLVQVKPAPRRPRNDGESKDAGFAAFVKQNFATTKSAMSKESSSSHKAVMEALGQAYRAEKAKERQASHPCGEQLAHAYAAGVPEAESKSTGVRGDGDDMKRLAERVEVIEIADD